MHKLIMIFLFSLSLIAGNLDLKEGFIAAHTEMLIDKTIDPLNTSLQANLNIKNNEILSLRGKFWIEMKDFSSDNKDRDIEMHVSNDVTQYPLATFELTRVEITQEDNIYILHGDLTYFSKTRPFSAKAEILSKNNTITIKATSTLKVSDHGVEMPCLLFMCVQDEVDLFIKAVLVYK